MNTEQGEMSMSATPDQVTHYQELAREAWTTPLGLFTPLVNGERVELNVIGTSPGQVLTSRGELYRWASAPCGLGCYCDVVAWKVSN